MPIYIQDCGFHSALGSEVTDIHGCLKDERESNMVEVHDILNDGKHTVVGQIAGELPPIPSDLTQYATRNNQLALSALHQIEDSIEQAKSQFGADRIAVVIGTSTSGISDGEAAFKQKLANGEFPADYHYSKQELGDTSEFVSQYCALTGPNYVISTACSSSGRVFLTAQRLLDSGIADAVLVGGVDTLCKLTLNGFHGLEALSTTHCKPFSATRDGINIGEAAAFMLLSKTKLAGVNAAQDTSNIALLGCGDSSDAHHISAPHPEGNGAEQAMKKALHSAQLNAEDIGYINAHGTATPLNDSMESKAIHRIFANKVPVSSTKPLTGHTLGAASAIEAAIAWHILKYDLPLPLQKCQDKAEDIEIDLVNCSQKLKAKNILSNSFAFGGNNISLIFGVVND
ncbi:MULTISPECIES: beta-ketoacyl-[acyl-carrier-protein] synthase family protein [unclassified Vibrio]|uniref:beta-ketoacyl-[acyl-carrier-protein] synthase family protein n=1 Tax=unclassified Vibrio TaxID=2614977 RepID=UPI000C841DBB|nr:MULTISPECIES: beta-ketoacyl-[acyl-carrier-protein] synthase family protein [unclassified Vibrio]PMI21476.1 beta-ketoacyl-[acyl-carrier-protein] synthase II [Vibrio sp. 10N.286.46.E10]PMI87630.1 beta-ketoacyl-[acyl-carrier-protein] synthase II [Vibrio sp. 10N.286.45.E10]PTP10915.1 beta-ketoacyl-[acyl-carrier-protein] synthase II [Vibrio sp. 10N.286.45.A3]PTQ22849.1 beta-ketoacyl-[acyl-carrier-protein] synthase II [Vibrio sp. 10N.286.46.E10]TKE81781.1 beta-ketoacyl-[acyl-carrier-protein] synt